MKSHQFSRRSFISSMFGCAFCMARSAKSQNIIDLSVYVSNTQIVLDNGRKLIEPTLSPDELATARSIRYRVQASWNNNAFAAWENNRRLVVINAGLIQSFDGFANALLIDKELGYTGCLEAYGEYLGHGVIDNSQRAQQGLPSSPVLVPGAYAVQFPGPCHGFDITQFKAKPELGTSRARMMEKSIMFVYLHELGHHVLNHVPPNMVDTASKQMHRSQEDAADQWAITTGLRAGYSLLGAFPWTIFIALLGGNSIEAEIQSTHPLGLRRDLVLYQQILNFYHSNPQSWKGDTDSYQGFIGELQQSVQTATKMVDGLQ